MSYGTSGYFVRKFVMSFSRENETNTRTKCLVIDDHIWLASDIQHLLSGLKGINVSHKMLHWFVCGSFTGIWFSFFRGLSRCY